MEGLRKSTKAICQDSRYQVQDFNPNMKQDGKHFMSAFSCKNWSLNFWFFICKAIYHSVTVMKSTNQGISFHWHQTYNTEVCIHNTGRGTGSINCSYVYNVIASSATFWIGVKNIYLHSILHIIEWNQCKKLSWTEELVSKSFCN